LQTLPSGEIKKANQRSEWLKQVACFSEALAEILLTNEAPVQTQSMMQRCEPLLKRFGSALEIDATFLETILKKVESETRQLAISLDVYLTPISVSDQLGKSGSDNSNKSKDADFCNEFMLASFDTASAPVKRHQSGKPTNARDLLLAGVQDTTQMLASNHLKLNDLILLVLETLYSALGFRFACVCLRDIQTGKYLARVAMGERYLERQKAFVFSAQDERSVFQLALSVDDHPKLSHFLEKISSKTEPRD
jgi:hypothetical protein